MLNSTSAWKVRTILLTTLMAASVMLLAQAPASAPAAPSTRAELNPKLPTLFVIGDSTAADRAGWGDPLSSYFDPAKIKQVILNVIKNSVEAITEKKTGGKINVQTEVAGKQVAQLPLCDIEVF